MVTTAADPTQALKRAQALLETNQLSEALALTAELQTAHPDRRDVLYVRAVTLRVVGRPRDALTTLARLAERYPQYPRLHQECGLCHLALRATPLSVAAFEQAVALNPWLTTSWDMLTHLYKELGQHLMANRTIEHIETLHRMPPALLTAFSMYADGEKNQSEMLVRDFIAAHGNHMDALRLLAKIAADSGMTEDAVILLEHVLALFPDHEESRSDYALALSQLGRYAEALISIRHLLTQRPNHFPYQMREAVLFEQLGENDRALNRYRELAQQQPATADLQLTLGHMAKTMGYESEAIKAYHAAAALQPSLGDAYWSLANLKTYQFTTEEMRRMQLAEANPSTAPVDRYHLAFALGKAKENAGAYAESFRYYTRGNAAKKAEVSYAPELLDHMAKLQRELCTIDFFKSRSNVGLTNSAPIFIVGLPRSGSTLLEQILASHSQIDGTMELPAIPRLVTKLLGREVIAGTPRYPGVLAHLTALDLKTFGEEYIKNSELYRSGKPHFIDKMPNNFRHIGLISLMLPNAKIIDARRNPMACCFSNFKQLFASGQEFTYSLSDVAHYYRSYLELMEHWDRVLPGRILRVQHEDVVSDLNGQVRRMLDFCGLDFEQTCVDFYRNTRSVHTASAQQVRQPIDSQAMDQWRHFEPWLGPLREALGDAL